MDCHSAEEVELYPMDNESASKTEVEARRWWVLNHVAGGSAGRIRRAREAVDRLNVAESLDLELWAPSIVSAVDVGGRMIRREVALTYHYVFVRGRLRDVKRLCGSQNGFSFVIDRAGADRYAHVSDAQMTAFRIIARGYENRLPFFRIEDVELEDGDLVEVMDGAFAGLIGRFMARKGSSNGNIAVQTSGGLGTMAFNVDARSVRVLEFAAGSRRAYDQIDAFAPRLFGALRKMRLGEQLTDKEIASLTVFVRRMERADLGSGKLAERLAAMLLGAMSILGETAAAADARRRLDRLGAFSPLALFVRGALDRAPSLLRQALAALSGDPASDAAPAGSKTTLSKSASALRDEILWHLSPTSSLPAAS